MGFIVITLVYTTLFKTVSNFTVHICRHHMNLCKQYIADEAHIDVSDNCINSDNYVASLETDFK